MTLVVKILTGSPEQWVEIHGSAVVVNKACEQCGRLVPIQNLNWKYCSDRCAWDAQNDRRARSTTHG